MTSTELQECIDFWAEYATLNTPAQDAKEAEKDAMLAKMRAWLEELRWIPVTESLPDAETTVMISMEDGEVWTGFHDGDDGWRYVSADPASGVKAWRHMPEGAP